MKNIELLAPVGSYDALVASVQNGANAVYLSGADFGARKFAKNFTKDEIVQAIAYAHIRDVKVYVTVNTLIKDEEWQAVIDYIEFLYLNDVDAIIVQDLGLAQYILTHYPDLDLHASTQMSAHNIHDVRYLKSKGFKRVVVAREMTMNEIKTIRENVDVEIEVFVHGALCISYSGQCLMSSAIGGRSGNRGRCAQPCRQLYSFDNEKSYAISPKDLNALEAVEQLIEMNVSALKIEGRMKGPEYAATVVQAYRSKIDEHSDENHLDQIFNRSYTKGFLLGDSQVIASDAPGNRGEYVGTVEAYDMYNNRLSIRMDKMLHKGDEIQIRRKESSVGARTDIFYIKNRRVKQFNLDEIIDVDFKYNAKVGEKIYRTYDASWMDEASKSYLKEIRRSPVTAFVSLQEGQAVYLEMKDDHNHKVTAISDAVVEKAIKVPLDEERIGKQLSKLGQTSYELTELEVDVENGVSISVKVLNDLRRECTDQLDRLREKSYDRSAKIITEKTESTKSNLQPRLSVSVRTKAQYEAIRDLGIEEVYCYEWSEDMACYPRLYRVTPGNKIDQLKEKFKSYDGPILIGNLGQLDVFKNQTQISDFSLNALNSHSVATLDQEGIKRVTLSYEMSKRELAKLKLNDEEVELIVYGHMPVMIMAYCPITKSNMHCDNCAMACQNNQVLVDRFEEEYPMIKSDERLEILSSKRLHLMPYLVDVTKVDYYRLDFSIETPETVVEITKGYLNYLETGEKFDLDNTMHHHFLNGVE